MAKRDQHYAEARRLYVQERYTFEQIEAHFETAGTPVSERSIREWAKDGQWANQRESIEEIQAKSSEKLHKVMDKLLDRIIRTLDDGKEPNPALLNFVKGVAPSLVRLQDYEEAASPDSEPDKAKAAERLEAASDEIQKTLAQLGLLR